jgi:hypothetical protein
MTKGILIKTTRGNYVLSDPEMGLIQGERDILDLMTLCDEAESNKVLISQQSLNPEFFDLSTGQAGEISHKLSTYRVKTAFVVDLSAISSERFQEWVFECNRGTEIRFFEDMLEAEDWLLE